jgi:hypothetical protein
MARGLAPEQQQIVKSLQMDSGGLLTGQYMGGSLSNTTFERLQKALVASPSTPGGPGDGSSLIPQSLARTLKNVSFGMHNIKFWKNIRKEEAYAMTEEYDQLLAYGSRGGVFTSAMATPQGNDSTFARVQVPMKYMATAYATDIAIMSTEVIGGSAEALQINDATRYLLRGVERNLFYGDSSLLPTAFDGVKKIIENFATSAGFTNIVIDAKAGPPTIELFEEAEQAIQDNAGEIAAGKHMAYMAPAVQSYWSRVYAPAQRAAIDERALYNEGSLKVGVPVGGYNGTFGYLPFINDIFLNPDVPVQTTIQNAPAIPTGVSAVLNATDAASAWQTPTNANQYGVGYNGGPVTYKIEADNSAGPSELSAATTSVTVGAGESVSVTWNRVTGANAANYYTVYRSITGVQNGAYLPVQRVVDAGTGVTQTFTDENTVVAGAFDIFIINHDPMEGAVMKQLLPFFKWPLPIPAMARYFAVALIGAPIIYVPSRCVLIKNVQIPNVTIAPVQLT